MSSFAQNERENIGILHAVFFFFFKSQNVLTPTIFLSFFKWEKVFF